MTTEQLVRQAILHYLDAAEDTVTEGRLFKDYIENKENSILFELYNNNAVTPRISAMIDVFNESKEYKCSCGSELFEIDCPAIVCKSCKTVHYIKTDNTKTYCKTCTGYNQCLAKDYQEKTNEE